MREPADGSVFDRTDRPRRLAVRGVFQGLFAGGYLALVPEFEGHSVWRAVDRHKGNRVFITGDVMVRPMIDVLVADNPETSES